MVANAEYSELKSADGKKSMRAQPVAVVGGNIKFAKQGGKTQPKPATLRPAPLTREERAALKRKVNLVLAAGGALLLVVTFVVLSFLER